MKHARPIAVVTGTRAEYGLLEPVMQAVAADRRLRLRVVVAGMHLVTGTWRDIRLPIDAKAPMQRKGQVGRAADVAALGRGITGFGKAFAKIEPDVVMVLGDRIEAFAAASAASVGGFRVAHIHGGDRAEGVADEAMRHAITKLAHLHFTATETSRKRVLRMGELPRWVWNVGSPAMSGLREIMPAEDDVLAHLGLDPAQPYVMVMQHPCGGDDEQEQRWMAATLEATRGRPRIVLSPNHDPGRAGVLAALRKAKVQPIDHLPRGAFLALLKRAEALVGNSSAGLIEAAAIRPGGVKVINVGDRQAGRERPANVIDCEPTPAAIRAALAKPGRAVRRHPYGNGSTPQQIADLLARVVLNDVQVRKRIAY